ncbi:synemin [Betta splendens]|uniref:Synemin n=1 Tax=Betta splendens TaxID=158456 RepID=A0A6P7MP84_BETSP|nr:synemin [Betta splendens]
MLPFKRTFESEKLQLQELNGRLAQYLSRTKQLEQENARLVAEIQQLKQTRTPEWEARYKAEVRDMRRTVEQLSFEKSRAEMEREKLWRDLQVVRSACSEHSDACRGLSGELQGCEKELQHAHKTNDELQQRLLHLQGQCKRLEDAHRRDAERARLQAESRAAPVVARTHRGPPVASAEEVQEYARGLSEGWMETFEGYQRRVEAMEQAAKADQARLLELQREKTLYAAELDKLRAQAEKQGRVQLRLEEELMLMQDRCRVDFGEYQMIIEQLERERNMMADAMEEKMRELQHLLQVKMDLGMEVAAYRALLEGQRLDAHDAHRRVNQHQRERIIDIKMSPQPFTTRASTLTTRQHMEVKYTPPSSSLRRCPVPSSGSRSPSRVIPISVAGRAQHQSPASRRDMISFTKSRAAPAPAEAKQTGPSGKPIGAAQKTATTEEKRVEINQGPPMENEISRSTSSTAEIKSVRVVSPHMSGTESPKKVPDEGEKGRVHADRTDSTTGPREQKVLGSVSVEEIIEKVMKPAGLEAHVCSSGDSKVRYNVEKTELEDGTTKTQIVLESKVEEELDVSEESTLDQLLSQGVKKVTLEDVKATAAGSMIQNLLSSLQGVDDLQNKSVNVEIIEEPVVSLSDEELEVERGLSASSPYFQIEELENAPHGAFLQRSDDNAGKSTGDTGHPQAGSVHVQHSSTEGESLCFSHEPHEYFVSTPDDHLSEPEDGGGITSYGHYGIVDDLSDERYYQDEGLPPKRLTLEDGDEYKYLGGDHSFGKESFPECIIEEEVRVSPIVQESVLEFLREDSLEPKEQLKGALETIQGSVSGPLREELAFLTKMSSDSPQNVAINVKKVQQSSGNGTTTIVAELNVSQTLEDSGLLEAGEELSEEQIMAALRSSNLGLEDVFQGGMGGGYSLRVSTEESAVRGGELEGLVHHPEQGKVGPTETSFTFQTAPAEHTLEVPEQDSQEKRVATLYLESPQDE